MRCAVSDGVRRVVLDAEVERPDVERRRLRGERGARCTASRPCSASSPPPCVDQVADRLAHEQAPATDDHRWFMRRSDSCPTWAIAGRSASSASASAIGWKLPLLSIRPGRDVDQRVVVHRVELDRDGPFEDRR